MQDTGNPWKIKDEKILYDNPWIKLTEYKVVNPKGKHGIYGKVHFKNIAIGIVTLDEDRNTYLVGQYRFTLNEYSWEIPEGGSPLHEAPLEGAKRELKEETGLLAEEWKEIMRMHLSNSVTDEVCIVYLATKLTQTEAQPEDTEDLRIKKIPFSEAIKMINEGQITDAVSVAALLKVHQLIT